MIGADPKKEQYKDEVFAVLTRTYQDIGGLMGSGLSSPDDMVQNIPFWKVAVKQGRVVAVVLYKDKNGRKAVASGTDGSHAGKRAILDILKKEHTRSYVEKSKASLGLFMKTTPAEKLPDILIDTDTVKKILPDTEIVPAASIPPESWPVDDPERESTQNTLNRWPMLSKYGYFRDLAGSMKFKVMLGTPFQKIQ
jgi:hypothetical protein